MPPVRAKARAKARAKPKARPQVVDKALRQSRRRQAVTTLNALANEISLAAPPLDVKTANGKNVEHFILLLERRCQTDNLPQTSCQLFCSSLGEV